jgi:hypothetical protein
MYVTAYDAQRSIIVSLHVGGPLTEEEMVGIESTVLRACGDALSRTRFVTGLILIETDCGPTPVQRKRIGEATRGIQRGHTAFVTRSTFQRGIITVLGWLGPGSPDSTQSTHATYEDARALLAARTGHSTDIFDVLHQEVRARASPPGRRSLPEKAVVGR